MLKTKINKELFEHEYPCLKIASSGLVVLFTEYGHGTVIVENIYHSIGTYSPIWKMEDFKPFKGTVELIQEN